MPACGPYFCWAARCLRVRGGRVLRHQGAVLVGAEMPVPTAEQLGELTEEFIDELRRPRIGDVERSGRAHTRRIAQLEVGVGAQDRAQMAGGVDLGDDLDVQPARESEDLPHLRLGEVLRRDHFGVRVGLDTERLVVGEVQAELVELEVGHLAQPVLDPGDGVVLAGDVEVEATLRPVGAVAYLALGHFAVGAHRLLQGSGSVEDTGLVGAADRDPSVVRSEGVRLRGALAGSEGQLHIARAGGDVTPVADLQFPGEQLTLVRERPAAVGDHDPGGRAGPPAGAAGGNVFAYGGDGAGRSGERVAPGRRGGGRGARGSAGLRLPRESAVGAFRPDDDGDRRGSRRGEDRTGHKSAA